MNIIRDRTKKISSLFDELSLDLVVIVDETNLEYFTGVDSGLMLIVNRSMDTTLIVPRLDFQRVQEIVNGDVRLIGYSTIEIPRRMPEERLFVSKSLGDYLLREVGLKPNNIVGIDNPDSPVAKELNSVGVKIVNINDSILRLREIKDEYEVSMIEEATRITEESLDSVLKSGLEGRRERDVAAMLYQGMISRGAEDVAFKPIVASGPNGAYPHHVFTDRAIRRGELVTIDVGARYHLYCTDMTRTVAVGSVNGKLRDAALAVLEAFRKASNSIKPGIKAKDVDSIARSVLAEYGFDSYYIHSTGHGVGIEVHERPSIGPSSDEELRPNEVITVEPGVYIKGVGGVRIEDTILVTETGSRAISRYPVDLF
ncbi:aminopeptidase P family protein [Vulcanisaeta sp. JCM 16161]|uniref:aminopeptidase P family protein n=1 Tax=Vulcanisaeta sp. JCM 16161 TaxID=1295372 RepID=UPI0006D1DF3C|nr:aminopeptidase P family protein [Vulcanisaeta sp. JCM 16161]